MGNKGIKVGTRTTRGDGTVRTTIVEVSEGAIGILTGFVSNLVDMGKGGGKYIADNRGKEKR
ncbi:MAG: hypothetical protein FWB78_07625 [Treponema sp.]|nr:hypothetical protein [Treponema sp.]